MAALGTESPTQGFVFAIAKRLAALLLPLGFGLGEFLQTAKAAFVAAAADYIRAHGDRVSTSQIAVITGLTRPEVAKIRSNHGVGLHTKATQRTARVMEGWFTDAEFTDGLGSAKALRFRGAQSFSKLVKKWAGDVPPRAVLRELLAGGMASQDSAGSVIPLRRHFESADGETLDLAALAVDIDVLVSNACSRQGAQAASLRRVSVSFDGRIPKAVRRNVAIRTERFLNAMTEYLHGVADYTDTIETGEGDTESFKVVVAQHGSDEESIFDRRNHLSSSGNASK